MQRLSHGGDALALRESALELRAHASVSAHDKRPRLAHETPLLCPPVGALPRIVVAVRLDVTAAATTNTALRRPTPSGSTGARALAIDSGIVVCTMPGRPGSIRTGRAFRRGTDPVSGRIEVGVVKNRIAATCGETAGNLSGYLEHELSFRRRRRVARHLRGCIRSVRCFIRSPGRSSSCACSGRVRSHYHRWRRPSSNASAPKRPIVRCR